MSIQPSAYLYMSDLFKPLPYSFSDILEAGRKTR